MIDTNTELRTWLLTQSTIADEVSTRIYWPQLPERYDYDNRKAIAFFCRGGSNHNEIPLLEPSIQFKCFGATSVEAREVYRALYDTLYDVDASTDNAYILSATEETAGQDLRDQEDENSFFVLTFWKVQFIER